MQLHVTPGFTLTQNQWNDIITNTNISNECLLAGDFNAHNKNCNWQYTDTNEARPENLLILNDKLFIHNHDTFKHIDTHRNTVSNIDLVLSIYII